MAVPARSSQSALHDLISEARGDADLDPGSKDWDAWVARVGVVVVKESPSATIAACQELAALHRPFAQKLFKFSFLSCVQELTDDTARAFSDAIASVVVKHAPFAQRMLDTAELFEHQLVPSKTSILSDALACEQGTQVDMFAKALYFQERRFCSFFDLKPIRNGFPCKPQEANSDMLDAFEALVHIHQALRAPESAEGLLAFVVTHSTADASRGQIAPSLYEKLGQWTRALSAYDAAIDEHPDAFHYALGRLRCLQALSAWEELFDVVKSAWPVSSEDERKATAGFACSAAVGLREWPRLAEFIPYLPTDTADTHLYQVLCLCVCVHARTFLFFFCCFFFFYWERFFYFIFNNQPTQSNPTRPNNTQPTNL